MARNKKSCKRCPKCNINGPTERGNCQNCGEKLESCYTGGGRIIGVVFLLLIALGGGVYCIGYRGGNHDVGVLSEQIKLKNEIIAKLEVSNQDKIKQLTDIQKKVSDLEKRLINKSEQDNMDLRIDELERDNTNLKKKNQEQNQQIGELEQDNTNLKKKNQEQNQQIDELERDNTNLKKKNQEQNQQIGKLEKDHQTNTTHPPQTEQDKQQPESQKKQPEPPPEEPKKDNNYLKQQIMNIDPEQLKKKQKSQKISKKKSSNRGGDAVKQSNKEAQSQTKQASKRVEQEDKQNSQVAKSEESKRQPKRSIQPPKCSMNKGEFTYYGECKNGLPNGWGVMTFSSGERYEGQFKKGVRDGCGTHIFPDGEKIENHLWRKGKLSGDGETCKDL